MSDEILTVIEQDVRTKLLPKKIILQINKI